MIKAFFFLFYSEKCPKYKKINPILYFFQQKGLKFEICSLFLMCFHPKTGFRSFFAFCCSIFAASSCVILLFLRDLSLSCVFSAFSWFFAASSCVLRYLKLFRPYASTLPSRVLFFYIWSGNIIAV